MLTAILAFITAIPGIGSAVTGVTTAVYNAKVRIIMARTGADRDAVIGMLQTAAKDNHENTSRLAIFASNPFLTFMLIGFASPLIVLMWKVIVVDKVIGAGCIWFTKVCWIGTTDSVKGQVADWSNTIIMSLFGSGTSLAIGKMWFNRDKTGE